VLRGEMRGFDGSLLRLGGERGATKKQGQRDMERGSCPMHGGLQDANPRLGVRRLFVATPIIAEREYPFAKNGILMGCIKNRQKTLKRLAY
jgi:hypothetical protein